MNPNDIKITIYRANQIRDWLTKRSETEGLSSAIISPTRAFAIINNPYVKDNDPIVAALFLTEKEGKNTPVAYTAAFPDMINEERKWWFSTLWCNPEHQGKGYALAVVGSLAEEYGEGNYYDSIGAAETVEIFRFLKLNTIYINEYRFGSKVSRHGWKGEINHIRQKALSNIRALNPRAKKAIRQTSYRLQYTHNIDSNTYDFMIQHSGDNYMTRTLPMLNWILSYPFKQNTPLDKKVKQSSAFTDTDTRYWLSAVKVIVEDQLVGVYILRDSDTDLSVKYLYYNTAYRDTVFASIVEHILKMRNPCFSTRHTALARYIDTLKLFAKKKTLHVSFSCPEPLPSNATITLQAGDGDGFV